MTNEGLVSRIYKEPLQINKKRTGKRKMSKNYDRLDTKEDEEWKITSNVNTRILVVTVSIHQMANKHMERFSTSLVM